MEQGLTKEHSAALHGLAIILMLFHHLFCIPSRLNCEYFSVIDFFAGGGTGERVAWFCKICVATYAFTSGYALSRISMKGTEPHDPIPCVRIIKQLIQFARKYIIVDILFVPLGFIFADFASYGLKAVVKSFCGSSVYNGEWWYISFYICALIAFPFMDTAYKKLCEITSELRFSKLISMAIAGALFGYIMTLMGASRNYAIILIEGYACSELKVFEFTECFIKDKVPKLPKLLMSVVLLIAVIIMRDVTATDAAYNRIDIIIIIPFVYSTVNIFSYIGKSIKRLAWLGRYSTYMWLTHTFYAYYIFQEFITISKVDLVMFVQLFVVSLLTAILLTQIEKAVCKAWSIACEKAHL